MSVLLTRPLSSVTGRSMREARCGLAWLQAAARPVSRLLWSKLGQRLQSLCLQVVPESNQSERKLHRQRLRHPIRGAVSLSVAGWVPAGWKPVPQSRAGRPRTLGAPLAARVSGRKGLLIVVGGRRPSIAQALQEELGRAPAPSGLRRSPDPRASGSARAQFRALQRSGGSGNPDYPL